MFHRFHVPKTGNAVFWYAYGSNNVYMVHISAEHSLEEGTLASADEYWFQV